MHPQSWRSLMVGNSRWHWGAWVGDRLERTWDDPQPPIDWPEGVWAASVVPAALVPWRDRPDLHEIHLADIPIAGLYPSLGIDRALAVWGAGQRYGFPAIAIDGGTALTLTAVDEAARLLGGAIAPGLGLQLRSLTEKTAALPPVLPPDELPDLWDSTTDGAIAGGVAHGVTALVQRWLRAWRDRYPTGTAVLTGGDGPAIARYLRAIDPELAAGLHCDSTVVFAGMAAVRAHQLASSVE